MNSKVVWGQILFKIVIEVFFLIGRVQYGVLGLVVQVLDSAIQQGRVVRKPVNANPGLKFNRGNNFYCIKALFIAYILCCLRLLVFETEGQKM